MSYRMGESKRRPSSCRDGVLCHRRVLCSSEPESRLQRSVLMSSRSTAGVGSKGALMVGAPCPRGGVCSLSGSLRAEAVSGRGVGRHVCVFFINFLCVFFCAGLIMIHFYFCSDFFSNQLYGQNMLVLEFHTKISVFPPVVTNLPI